MTGCASLDSTPPESFDLTGDWRLNAALSDSPSLGRLGRPSNAGGGGREGRPEGGRGGGNGGARGGPPSVRGQAGASGAAGRGGGKGAGGRSGRGGGRVQVDVLQSSCIVIEQDIESMGMQFDPGPAQGSGQKTGRGVYRDVSWGTRVRGELEVTAGWDERVLVIETNGGTMPVVERYTLSEDRQRMSVVVELNGGRDDLRFLRVFDRAQPNELRDEKHAVANARDFHAES